jgi:putative salt-induced outer membrane protein YdiY
MPMALQPGEKRSLEDRVRAYAMEHGWTCGYGVDFCPGKMELD